MSEAKWFLHNQRGAISHQHSIQDDKGALLLLDMNPMREPEAKAAMILAVAAPDLLEALELVDQGLTLKDYRASVFLGECIGRTIKAAITKAKGESQ